MHLKLEFIFTLPPKQKTEKKRLDVLVTERGLAESRQKAQALILAGQIQVNGQRADKVGAQFLTDSKIETTGQAIPFVSRGGVKLEGALQDFKIDPSGRVCMDVGSSTGGFTDCLLQHGAVKVFAVDVSTDQLDWKLRQNQRVIPVERNARALEFGDVGENVNLITVDLSFISTAKVLPTLVPFLMPGGVLLVLVKPQFELERDDVGRGGIVRDAKLHQKAIDRIKKAAKELGLQIIGVYPSHLTGAGGNQEFFLYARQKD
ncbi:MAG: TlyA family RNA methyltransferase [Acidobacteria bacterium]|nr:TlyA family RNA methyltransferase [Acidobacteriota bacterium]